MSKGTWVTVTKAEDVKVGDRVRYKGWDQYGYDDKKPQIVKSIKNCKVFCQCDVDESFDNDLFYVEPNGDLFWRSIEKFVSDPEVNNPKKSNNKPKKIDNKNVVDVLVTNEGYGINEYQFCIYSKSSRVKTMITSKNLYTRKSDAKRAAKSYCKYLGFEAKFI
jgi:hypothetical protein